MEKILKVLVAGIPISAQPIQEWRKNSTFKVAGKAPKVRKRLLAEEFVPGTTRWLRKPIVKALKDSALLFQRDFKTEVTDLGELTIPDMDDTEGKGIPETQLVQLAKDFAIRAQGFDLTILLGGDHTGGLLLYGFVGKVARYDEHSDACMTPDTCPSGSVERNNYVCAAIRNGLKIESTVLGVGVREGDAPYQITTHAQGASVMDIDVDVIAQKFGIKSDYSKGTLSPDDLVGAVRKSQPLVLGLFEMVEPDKLALKLAVELCEEAAVAATKRLSRKKR